MRNFCQRAINTSSLAVITGWLIALFLVGAGIIAVNNAYPQIYQVGYPNIHPRSVAPGGPGFILAVSGTHIYSYSTVYWNDTPKSTVDFVSGYLEVQIPATDIAKPGIVQITVYTPDLGYSPQAPFTIEEPPPFLGSIVPNAMPAEGPGFVLMAIGTYAFSDTISPFTKDSVVQWNGSDRETTFIDSQHLQATILASDLASPGSATITVAGQSGATSQAQTFTIKDPIPTINLNIEGGGAAQHKTSGGGGSTQTGYATITNSGCVPHGTAVLSFKNDNITVSEVAIPPSPPTFKARVFIEYRAAAVAVPGRIESGNVDINTGIAIVNYGASTASVTYTLRDLHGELVATGHGNVSAGNHDARFINQLKDAAPDFALPLDFQTATQFGSLDIQSDQPLSVLALRGTKNQRNDFLITTTPLADLGQTNGNDPSYFPQFADGGGYTTALALMNTSKEVETGRLEILNDDGSPMTVSQVGGASNSTFRYSIPAGGAYHFQTDGSATNARAGWARLIPDASTSTPVGVGIFSYNPENVLVSESGISSATPTTHARVYVDLSNNHNTGLALANPNSDAEQISIYAYDNDGITIRGTSKEPLHLDANGHAAMFANQIIQGLPAGFKGVLDIRSSAPFAALTIRALNNERNDFLMATFPVASPNQLALTPLLFPHFAEGGGYTTEFIFLSPSGASTVAIGMFSDAGIPRNPAN
jgi:hypothetical protein